MPEQEEKAERIFPVLNRRTPVLDRIRGNGRSGSVAFKLGNRAAESVMSDNDMELAELSEKSKEEFKAGAADALGVNTDNINDALATEVARVISGLDESEILTDEALVQLGLAEDDTGTEVESLIEEEDTEEEDLEESEEPEGGAEDRDSSGTF